MSALKSFNLRDKGAEIWAGWNRLTRTVFVSVFVLLIALLPFAPNCDVRVDAVVEER